MEMKLIRDDLKGKVYEAAGLKIFLRNRESVSGDNSENAAELIYLLKGMAEVTTGDRIYKIQGPAKIEFPARTYHKIKALTDIVFVLLDS
ncbi:MAG: hypothetical protein WC052_01270 [Patescibacteria group bacterium]|jgi:mannose-6-phosphate isomerase-like protein (cupin superfamily)